MTAYAKLGDRIAGNRAFCGYTQRQLAEMVGVHFSYISHIENGTLPHAPSRKLLDAIGKAIHIEPVELYMLSGQFDDTKLHKRALEDMNTAALLLMIEDGLLSSETIATITAMARKLEGDDE